MASLQKSNMKSPDEVRELGKGKISILGLGEGNVGRLEYQPGWKWSTDAKPIHKTDSCQLLHVGLVESGVIHVKMDEGAEEDLEPGDVYYVPPGHDAWVTSKEPFVAWDFGAVAKH